VSKSKGKVVQSDAVTGMKYFDVQVPDFDKMKLDGKTGALTIEVPVFLSLEEARMRVCFSPEATHKLYIQLGRLQQVLEKNVQGSPPSDARH